MSAKKKPAGMKVRPPKRKPPSEEAIRAFEASAEEVASKAPGIEAMPPATPEKKKPARKAQITAYLPTDVRDHLRQVAVALSGPPRFESVTSIVERAIRAELEKLEEEHGPFEPTSATPRPGRRPSQY